MQTYPSDNELINLISFDQTGALEQLIERYRDYAYNIAIKVTGNREMAEEVVQDSFLKVYQYAARFKMKSKFSTWFYKIVYTTALATREKQSKTASGDMEFKNTGYTEKKEELFITYDRDYRTREIEAAIKRLAPEYSLVLTLYYLNEQTIEEISVILGEKRGAVKVKLFRARKKLKDWVLHLKNVNL